MPDRLLTRLRNLRRASRTVTTRPQVDEETDRALTDAILQSALFCVSLLALVTCLARLPPQPPLKLQMPDPATMVQLGG
jgi:hypothetical protein